MKFHEYAINGDGTPVDITNLKTGFIPDNIYQEAQSNLVIACHDVYIEIPQKNGLLLVRRKEEPAKGLLWPIGGRMLRGMSTKESLRKKAQKECGLDLEDITYLGVARVFWDDDQNGHGQGLDALGFNFFARGNGIIKLNDLHEQPTIITPQQYEEFRKGKHPYLVQFMDSAMEQLQ